MMKSRTYILLIGLLTLFSSGSIWAANTSDSVDLKKDVKSSQTYIHSGVASTPPAVSNEDYSLAGAYQCPPATYCVNANGKIIPTFSGNKTVQVRNCSLTDPNCPPTNETLTVTQMESTSKQAYLCPKVCIAKRTLVTSAGVPSGSNPPICPDGYAQIGMLDMQPEVISGTTSPTTVPSRITMAKYSSTYLPNKYNCSPDPSTTPITDSKCLRRSAYNNLPVNCANVSFGTNMAVGPTQELGQYSSCDVSPSSQCYTDSVCTKPFGGSCSSMDYYIKMEITYQFDQCVAPSGLAYTSQAVPASIVCARIEPIWQNK